MLHYSYFVSLQFPLEKHRSNKAFSRGVFALRGSPLRYLSLLAFFTRAKKVMKDLVKLPAYKAGHHTKKFDGVGDISFSQ